MDENTGEVARLLRQIDLEYEAAQRGLNGLAAVARHQFITARMEAIERFQSALQEIVGEQEAARLLARPPETKEQSSEQS